MANEIMVWDLETVPDLEGYARANDLVGRSPEEIRAAMGPDFPKLIYHSIVCIGALGGKQDEQRVRGPGRRRPARRSTDREGTDRVRSSLRSGRSLPN